MSSTAQPSSEGTGRGVFRFAAYELDLRAGELRRQGIRIRLQDQPLQVLTLLLQRAGEVVTREEIRQHLWPADTFVDFDHSLNTAIKKLRQALNDDADNPRFIETLPRKGYRFIAPVHDGEGDSRVLELPVRSTAQQPAEPAVPRAERHTVLYAVIVLLAIALLGAALLLVKRVAPAQPASSALALLPLTSYPGDEMTPHLSPDGTRIAFAWNGANQDQDFKLYVKVIGTEEPRRLTSESGASDGGPAWSPDGRYIAFSRVANGKDGIYLMSAEGGPARLLKETNFYNLHMSWSPDGKYLAYADGDRPIGPEHQTSFMERTQVAGLARLSIFLLSIETLESRRLTTPPLEAVGDTSPAFSPDGSHVAFARDTRDVFEIYLVPASGGEPKQLTNEHAPAILGVDWSADGKNIIYGGFGLFRVSALGGKPEVLVSGLSAFGPSIRKNRIVFSNSNWSEAVSRVRLNGTKGVAIEPVLVSTRFDEGARLSPDGKTIVFQSIRTGPFEIWKANADGTNPIQLSNFNGPLTGTPHWSPDGKNITFDSRPHGNVDVFVISAEGGPPRRMTADNSNEAVPNYSRDGKYIYFGSDRGGTWNVWKIPSEGGPAVQVTRNGGFHAIESWDGKYLYYSKAVDEAGIWRVPVNGGEETMVLPEPGRTLWGYWDVARDGIYYVRWTNVFDPKSVSQVMYFDFATAKSSPVFTLPHHAVVGTPGLSVAPDGRSLLVTTGQSSNSDLMIAENLR